MPDITTIERELREGLEEASAGLWYAVHKDAIRVLLDKLERQDKVIERARLVIDQCQRLLADLTNGDPEFQRQMSSHHLWTRCSELEAISRSFLAKEADQP